LTILLPNGSSNSTDRGRTNLAGFLRLGGACPANYASWERDYFLVLPDTPDIRFLVGRPQNAPFLAARGDIDAFVAFQDIHREAEEAGITTIRKLLDLPFATISVVVVAREQTPCCTLADFLERSPCPVECAADLPFLARSAFREEAVYQRRFGSTPPAIEMHGTRIASGCEEVRITVSAGSTEPLVASGFYDCGVVVLSTGRTIGACNLKVISTIGTYAPALFCRAGVQDDPRLLPVLQDYVRRLEQAKGLWQSLQAWRQLELPYETA
jgi:ATP phosphoribosyltransferase